MAENATMQMIRIYVGSRDRRDGRPLHEAIVEMARQNGLAGATVIRGMLGYGRSGTIRRASLRPRLNEFPLVIQIADEPARIAAFLPLLETMVQGELVTVQNVEGDLVRRIGRSAARKGTAC